MRDRSDCLHNRLVLRICSPSGENEATKRSLKTQSVEEYFRPVGISSKTRESRTWITGRVNQSCVPFLHLWVRAGTTSSMA